MSDNIILTPNTYVRGVLMNLGGYLSFCRNMSKDYTKNFGDENAQVGDTVSVKKPQIFTTTKGLLWQPQPLANQKVNVTVGDVTGVHFQWDGVERTLQIQEAQRLYFKPAAIAIAHAINASAAQFIAQNTWNAVGTPGITPNTVDTYLGAGDVIVQAGLPPEEDLACIVNRKFSSQYVIGQKALYNPAGQISQMIKRGEVVDETLGYTWHRDQTIYSQTVGPLGGTPLVDGALTAGGTLSADGGNNGSMTLATKGWTASAAARLVQGDRFTIAGVYQVHPQTKQSSGTLQMFQVQAACSSTSGGYAAPVIKPAITPTGQYQNVSAAPVDGAAITMFGAANTVSPQGILMHRDAFAFVSLPLATPKTGVIQSAQQTDPDTGISLSLVRFFDGVNRVEGTRFDVLTGFAALYSELACAIAG